MHVRPRKSHFFVNRLCFVSLTMAAYLMMVNRKIEIHRKNHLVSDRQIWPNSGDLSRRWRTERADTGVESASDDVNKVNGGHWRPLNPGKRGLGGLLLNMSKPIVTRVAP
jgi:hypothetical protein